MSTSKEIQNLNKKGVSLFLTPGMKPSSSLPFCSLNICGDLNPATFPQFRDTDRHNYNVLEQWRSVVYNSAIVVYYNIANVL